MRKISVLLIVALLVTMFSFPAAADSSVTEFEDFGSLLIVLWDSIKIDGKNAPSDPVTYLEDFGAVGGPVQTVGVRGWAACNAMDITAFGYVIDDGEPVIKEEYKVNTEDAVIAAAQNAGCQYASRYDVAVDVSAVEGDHTIDFLIQFEDGTIVKMTTNSAVPVSFIYSADGSAVNATPEPTAEPDPESLDNAPGPILSFADEEGYENFFSSSMRNQIEDIYFDDEKGCVIISMDVVGDPYVVLMFSSLEIDDEPLEVDAEKYKILQLGVRINPNTGDRGQYYFQTDENAGYDEAKDALFDYEKTDALQYVNINLGKNKKWTGIMADCRLDPFGGNSEPCDYELYYMAFFTNEKAANDFGDKWLAEGALPTAEPTPTKAPTPEPTATPEAVITDAPVVTEAPKSTDAPDTTDAAKVTDKPADKDNTGNNKNAKTGLIIGIAIGVVAVAASVCGALIAKKKKK
ncbi:MAG: PT domain-containing protein [Clostridia bacterium]|nr:PT domain-containing protein [Clostridia bacterium]